MSDFENVRIYEDERYSAPTNAALEKLARYLIDTGHRLSVSQHSQIMRQVENAIDAEVTALRKVAEAARTVLEFEWTAEPVRLVPGKAPPQWIALKEVLGAVPSNTNPTNGSNG